MGIYWIVFTQPQSSLLFVFKILHWLLFDKWSKVAIDGYFFRISEKSMTQLMLWCGKEMESHFQRQMPLRGDYILYCVHATTNWGVPLFSNFWFDYYKQKLMRRRDVFLILGNYIINNAESQISSSIAASYPEFFFCCIAQNIGKNWTKKLIQCYGKDVEKFPWRMPSQRENTVLNCVTTIQLALFFSNVYSIY